MLTFGSEIDPKIDAKRKKKLLKLEVEEKKAKMLQNGCQKGSRKLPKLRKNRYEKRIKNGRQFFRPQRSPLAPPDPKTLQNATYICKSKKKLRVSFERETPTCAPVEAKR